LAQDLIAGKIELVVLATPILRHHALLLLAVNRPLVSSRAGTWKSWWESCWEQCAAS